MDIVGIDHVELFVADLEQAARSLCEGFGFQVMGEAGGRGQERCSRLLQQGHVRMVLTAAGHPGDEVAGYVELHGDGVCDVALCVKDAAAAFREAIRLGARPIQEPVTTGGPDGRLTCAVIASPVGDVVHSLVQRDAPESQFWPGRFRMLEHQASPLAPRLADLDHVALCVPPGGVVPCVEHYQRVLGLHQSRVEDVQTEYSGMSSRVVQDASGSACLVLMEPMSDKRPGQIGLFLGGHRGPGVQHVAFRSGDLLGAVRYLREHHVALMDLPPGYTERLRQRVRVEDLGTDWQQLREGCVLVDQAGSGYLLQAFTRPAHPRRTLFFEIIQRKADANGFGSANIRALYEAVEQELGHG